MSDPTVPQAPPVPEIPSLDAPPTSGTDELDPGPMRDAGDASPETEELTPEQQRAQIKSSLVQQLQEKHPECTDEWLESVKSKIGRVYIFPIFDDIYIIRPLRRGEWKKLQEGKPDGKPLSPDEMEEAIAQQATIFPELKREDVTMGIMAGIPTSITNFVELISGFKPEIGPILL